MIALRHLGPQIGLILAWRCMSVYAGSLQDEPDPNSAQWIGAWWIGQYHYCNFIFAVQNDYKA